METSASIREFGRVDFESEMIHISIMKTATVADLRNHFRQIARWILEGESVRVTKRGRPFATLTPAPSAKRRVTVPDFLKRMREEYPHKAIPRSESLALRDELRGDR